MSNVIYFRGSLREAKQLAKEFVQSLTGQSAKFREYAQSVFVVIGISALSDIQQDFIRKARGGTGEDGVTWPRLSPKTLAYSRRFGPGEQKKLKTAAGLGAANKFGIGGNGGLLSKAEQKRWWKHYKQALAWLAPRMDLKAAKARAASIAWNKIKAEGAKTKLMVYGNRQVEILRDTGILLNSLSPGYVAGNDYRKPAKEGGEDQIFEQLENGVIVGTNVKYASRHQNGGGGVPARPFLPVGETPEIWKSRWISSMKTACISALRLVYVGGQRA